MSRLAAIVIQCRDPYVAAPFWALALGVPPVPVDAVKLETRTLADGEAVLLREPSTPDVWISPVEDVPDSPTAVHLDLQLADLSELDRLVAAGARRRWTVPGKRPWTVLEAPDGILFCARHPVPTGRHP